MRVISVLIIISHVAGAAACWQAPLLRRASARHTAIFSRAWALLTPKLSLAAGKRLSNAPDARSICDAIVTPRPGEPTFPILQKTGCSGLSAPDEDALHAMHIAWSYFADS